jgi:chromosome segregation ATPase
MRAVSVLVFLAVGVMVVLMYQAVRQELTLRGLKARALESSSQVKQKENDIVQVKMKIQKLNGELEPINTKREELTKKKEQSAKATGEADKSLKTCHTEKVGSHTHTRTHARTHARTHTHTHTLCKQTPAT